MTDDAYGQLLRKIVMMTEVLSLRQLAHEPMNREIFRVTVLFSQSRAANSVTTAIRDTVNDTVRVETVFQGLFKHKPIVRYMDADEYSEFSLQLRLNRFDLLPQQSPSALSTDHDIWLVERASASFEKSIIMPNYPHDDASFDKILNLIKLYIPEVEREISP